MSETGIPRCLASLGFEDHSAERNADSDAVALWWPPAQKYFWDDSGPFATASVRRFEDRWTVTFVPPTWGGAEAESVANEFSRCMSLQKPGVEVKITSETGLDLR